MTYIWLLTVGFCEDQAGNWGKFRNFIREGSTYTTSFWTTATPGGGTAVSRFSTALRRVSNVRVNEVTAGAPLRRARRDVHTADASLERDTNAQRALTQQTPYASLELNGTSYINSPAYISCICHRRRFGGKKKRCVDVRVQNQKSF